MKIKNLRNVKSFMGYGPSGFTLQPGGVSGDLPISMLSNVWVQKDVRAGNIAVLLEGMEKNHAASLGITIPEKDVNAPAATITRASQVRPRETVDAMKAELDNQIAGFVNPAEKIRFLAGLLEKSSPAAKALAAELLDKLKATAAPKPAPMAPPVPTAPPQAGKPAANMAVSDADKGNSEPMVSIGTSEQAHAKADEPVKKKSPHQMSNLELLQHAIRIGIKEASPLTKRKALLEMVGKAEPKAE
jgi:hypothetical protein